MADPELILGPIVGGLSNTSANLWGRANGPGLLHAWLGRKPDLSDASPAGTSYPLQDTDGFAGVVPLRDLEPATLYYYDLRLDESPPSVQEGYGKFTTFPNPKEKHPFKFAFGSCFLPGYQKGDSGSLFRDIDEQRKKDDLKFILMIGDQVYADVWDYNGIGQAAVGAEDFRNVYAHAWSNKHFREMLKNLPAFMTLDDHEVDDDWHFTDATRAKAEIPIWDVVERFLKGRKPEEWQMPLGRVQAALKAYWEHQGMHGPRLEQSPELHADGRYKLEDQAPGSLAYSFACGGAAFFVLDTRTMRVKPPFGQRSMLGKDQWDKLEQWLLRVKDEYPVKFIVTSCSLLFRMWADIPRDRWSGFPSERRRLLRLIGDNNIQNLYLLAGDLHSGHAISAEVGNKGRRVPVWEFCSTPFEQKCNKLARWMYFPIWDGTVGRQKVWYTAGENNFGVVEVDYTPDGQPKVLFTLHGAGDTVFGEPVPPAN